MQLPGERFFWMWIIDLMLIGLPLAIIYWAICFRKASSRYPTLYTVITFYIIVQSAYFLVIDVIMAVWAQAANYTTPGYGEVYSQYLNSIVEISGSSLLWVPINLVLLIALIVLSFKKGGIKARSCLLYLFSSLFYSGVAFLYLHGIDSL
jgi:hypothetical protein